MTFHIVLAASEKSRTLEAIPHLEAEGWVVTTVHTGAEALALIEDAGAPVTIVDVDLPDITGFDMLQLLRQSSAIRSTVVILVYAAGCPDEHYFIGHRLGADVNLATPFDTREVISFLSRAFTRPKGG